MPGKPEHTHYHAITPYTTKDGSLIRELMHPDHGEVRNLSLAEAVVAPGQATLPHFHATSEEVYHILVGNGRMTLGDATFAVAAGDTIVIAPGTRHAIGNSGKTELRVLCCCAPPYRHADTSLTGEIEPTTTKE